MSDLTDLYARLAAYEKTEIAILEGNQSYGGLDGVTYSRPNLGQVQAEIRRLRAEIALLEDGGNYGCDSVVFGGLT